ncbi:hypothetical protein [Pseudomonas chlororaphis]|uniref:hypothetical protein n=1 Tax=Pseudomonas chlororaphis TaxID=587753 RepID=UPI00240878FF|nr:hypothetical protein [Pseudomonas chlororaphis]
MSTQSPNTLFQQFPLEDERDISLKIPIVLQSAFTVLQTLMAILQAEGPTSNVLLPIPTEWRRLQELAEDYSTQLGLKVSPKVYSEITVKGYSPTALRFAYDQILTNPKRGTVH